MAALKESNGQHDSRHRHSRGRFRARHRGASQRRGRVEVRGARRRGRGRHHHRRRSWCDRILEPKRRVDVRVSPGRDRRTAAHNHSSRTSRWRSGRRARSRGFDGAGPTCLYDGDVGRAPGRHRVSDRALAFELAVDERRLSRCDHSRRHGTEAVRRHSEGSRRTGTLGREHVRPLHCSGRGRNRRRDPRWPRSGRYVLRSRSWLRLPVRRRLDGTTIAPLGRRERRVRNHGR